VISGDVSGIMWMAFPSLEIMASTRHAYEVRPRKDQRGVDLISDALPFGRLWYVSRVRSQLQSVTRNTLAAHTML